MSALGNYFATKIQTNTVIAMGALIALQIYMLVALNGHFADIVMSKDVCAVATILAPTAVVAFMGRTLVQRKGNYDE